MSVQLARPGEPGPRDAGDAAGTAAGRWRAAAPELVIAAILVALSVAAAASVSGLPGVVAVTVGAAVVALLVLRALIPRSGAQLFRLARDRQRSRAISGYAQRRFIAAASLTSRPMYESDLRPILEHILAARLAESRGINLYTEPEAAHGAFCRTRQDEELWQWIDPRQVLHSDDRAKHRHGIPRRSLARLITRLEQL